MDKKKKKRNMRRKLFPHTGIIEENSFDRFLEEISSVVNSFRSVTLWDSHIYSILIFSYQMWRATSILDYIVAALAYSRRQNCALDIDVKSIQEHLRDIDDSNVNDSVSVDNDGLDPQASFSDIKDAWKVLVKHPLWKKISYLITAAMSIPALQMNKIAFSFAGIDIISFEACERQLKCVDIVDAVLDTFTWISETAWMVFKTGDLKYILYSDSRICRFNDLYMDICAKESSALSGNLPDLASFRSNVNEAIDIIARLQQAKVEDIISQVIERRYSHLCEIQERLILKDKNSAMRFQPIGFSLFGPTKVGKSTLGKLTMNTSLNAMGFSTDFKHQITIEPTEKYHSTMTTDVEGLFIDDLANSKSTFNKDNMSPSTMIIKFFNNISAQAIKAEIKDKGNVFFEFKCGVITTNKKDLDAPIYSNCPESILRRLYHVTVNIKPSYCATGTSTLNTDHPDLQNADLTHDVWLLTIEEVLVVANPATNSSSYRFKPISRTFPGDRDSTDAVDIDLHTYLRFVVLLSQEHKLKQDSLLNATRRFENIRFCSAHSLPTAICTNPNCQLQPNFDEYVIPQLAYGYVLSWVYNLFVPKTDITVRALRWIGYDNINSYVGKKLADVCYSVVTDNLVPFGIKYIPEFIFANRIFRIYYNFVTNNLVHFKCRWLRDTCYYALLALIPLCFLGFINLPQAFLLAFLISILILFLSYIHYCRVRKLRERLLLSRHTLSAYAQGLRDSTVPRNIVIMMTLIGIIKCAQIIYKNKYMKSPHISSLDKDEIEKQPSWFSNLFQVTGQRIPNNTSTNTMVSDQLTNSLSKNLFIASFFDPKVPEVVSRCCAFFPRKGVCILPKHIFYAKGDLLTSPRETLSIEITRHPSVGGKFSFISEFASSVLVAPDLVLLYVPNCPDLKNLIHYFPTDKPTGCGWNTYIRRHFDCSIASTNIYVTHGTASHSGISFPGGTYICDDIGSGACMSIVASKVNPSILGFHIAGRDNLGASILLLKEDLEKGIKLLDNQCCVIVSSNSTMIPEAQFQQKIVNSPIHPKAHVLSYDSNHLLDIIGQSRFGRTISSSVKVSILSESVMDIIGVPNTYGPPQMRPNWNHYNRVTDEVTRPGHMFPPSLLEVAVKDYLSSIYDCIDDYNEKVCPLSLKESIMGTGKRFIEPLPMQTSVGFPVFGKKEKFFVTTYGEHGEVLDRSMGPLLQDEYNRLVTCYSNNERGYPIFAACLKDEVKDVTSTKTRVFTAVPVAFGLLIRKYFLPIVRFLHHYPIQTEIAVGLNAYSLQWDELMSHVTKFATPSLDETGEIGMDYKGYDTRMNSQITRACLWILIHIAEKFGYTEDDLAFMRAMVNDLSHPCVDFNGVLLQLYAMNTSGNNITVQINCIANSLYNRMAYYSIYPGTRVPFRESVAMITYGDDMRGSVHENSREYNFLSVQAFLKEYDVFITAPDKKTDVSTKFFPSHELDFLKRQSNYLPEIGTSLGRLNEDSIFKSLHCNVSSNKVSPEDVASSCIECALHEWFAFGREHYDLRLSQMIKVCERLNLKIPILDVSFDDRVEKWKQKYLGSPNDGNRFTDASCEDIDFIS